MKIIHIGLIVALTSTLAFAGFPNIDSSNWKTDPVKHGMGAMEYINAESHAFMNEFAINRKVGLNSFYHFTALAKAEDKWVVSPSLDHLYSVFIIDTSKPFTVIVPDNDGRFVSLHMQDENHTFSVYKVGPGRYDFKPSDFDTRFVLGGVRIASDGTKANIGHIVNDLQPQLKVIGGGNGLDKLPKPDLKKMMAVREALIVEYDKLEDTFETVTYKIEDVKDWEKTTYTIAGAFALSPEDTAMYPAYALKDAVGGKCYKATYPAPPLSDNRGYFSITVYGEDKYLMSNEYNIVSSNHPTTKFNKDDSFTIIYGGKECKLEADRQGVNFAYTPTDKWGFLMRVYLPDVEAMKKYVMPEIKPFDTPKSTPVTLENYVVAESDWYFDGVQKKAGVNVWMHDDPVSKDNQQVIRSNRDVVYSIAIVDVSQGATFTVPKSDEFQIIHIIDEKHLFHQVVLNGKSLHVTADDIEGEYVYLLARTRDNGDLADTKARQNALNFEAKANRPYKAKGFNADEVIAFREELVRQVNSGEQPIAGHDAFGKTIADVDPHNYLYAAAYGWAGLPMTTAQYVALQVTSDECQTWTVEKPGLDWKNNGYMSATFYGADGWIKVDDFYIPHTEMTDSGDTFSFTTNCKKGTGNATVEKGGNLLIRMYLPIDAWEVKKTADSMYKVKGVSTHK